MGAAAEKEIQGRGEYQREEDAASRGAAVCTPYPRNALLPDGDSPPQQQLGVVFALQVLVNEVSQELLEDIGGILQFALQHGHDERGHVATVPHGEAALGLQCADEGQQEHLVVDELGEEL